MCEQPTKTRIPNGLLQGNLAQNSYVNGFRNIGIQIGLVEQIDQDLYWLQQNNGSLLLPIEYQRNGRVLGQIDWEFELSEDECVKAITRASVSKFNELGVVLSNLQIERPSILDIYPADIAHILEPSSWRFNEPNKHYLSGIVCRKSKAALTKSQLSFHRVAGVIWVRQNPDENEAIPVYCTSSVYEGMQVGMPVFVEANYKPSFFDVEEDLPEDGWLRAYRVSVPTKSDILIRHSWM